MNVKEWKDKRPSQASNLGPVTGSPVHRAPSHYSGQKFVSPFFLLKPKSPKIHIYPSPGADAIYSYVSLTTLNGASVLASFFLTLNIDVWPLNFVMSQRFCSSYSCIYQMHLESQTLCRMFGSRVILPVDVIGVRIYFLCCFNALQSTLHHSPVHFPPLYQLS